VRFLAQQQVGRSKPWALQLVGGKAVTECELWTCILNVYSERVFWTCILNVYSECGSERVFWMCLWKCLLFILLLPNCYRNCYTNYWIFLDICIYICFIVVIPLSKTFLLRRTCLFLYVRSQSYWVKTQKSVQEL
jgi:hypothetical protein